MVSSDEEQDELDDSSWVESRGYPVLVQLIDLKHYQCEEAYIKQNEIVDTAYQLHDIHDKQ